MGKRASVVFLSFVLWACSTAPAFSQSQGAPNLLQRLLGGGSAPPAPPVQTGGQDSWQLPPAAGSGRRVVYSNSMQRVWLVEDGEAVVRSYLVSGRQAIPGPGTYAVFSKSMTARARSGAKMQHMVRFAKTQGLDIGFHAIPTGRRGPIQSERELGQFRSLGCVRQAPVDAAFLWDWAPVGTTVVVTP